MAYSFACLIELQQKALRTIAFLLTLVCCVSSSSTGFAQQADDTYALVEKLKKATILINCVSGGAPAKTGTGFFVRNPELEGRTLFAITNAHVISSAKPHETSLTCITDSGTENEKAIGVEVEAIDEENDLAVLRLASVPESTDALDWNMESTVRETDQTYIVGFPFGEALSTSRKHPNVTISQSAVSSIRRDNEKRIAVIQLSGGVNPGNSGGPIVSKDGRLIGVAVAKVNGSDIGFAVPGWRVRELMLGKFTYAASRRVGEDPQKDELEITLGVSDPISNVENATLELVPRSGREFSNMQDEWNAQEASKAVCAIKLDKDNALARQTGIATTAIKHNPFGYLARYVVKRRHAETLEGDLFRLEASKTRMNASGVDPDAGAPPIRFLTLMTKAKDLVNSAAFSKDGRSCFIATQEGIVRKLSLTHFGVEAIRNLGAHCSQLEASREGIVLLQDQTSELLVLDEKTLATKKTIKTPDIERITCSDNLSVAYFQEKKGQLTAVDLKSGRLRALRLPKDSIELFHMTVSPDGKMLFGLNSQHFLQRLKLGGVQAILEDTAEQFSWHSTSIVVSPDSKRVAAVGGRPGHPSGYGTSIFSTSDLRKQETAIITGAYPLAVAFDPVSKNIYGQGEESILSVFSNKGGVVAKYRAEGLRPDVLRIAVHPKGNRVIIILPTLVLFAEIGDSLAPLDEPAKDKNGLPEPEKKNAAPQASSKAKLPNGSPAPNAKINQQSEFRIWSDVSGKFKVEAKFLRLDGTNAVLEKKDGSKLNIPLAKLSEEDNRLIKDMTK